MRERSLSITAGRLSRLGRLWVDDLAQLVSQAAQAFVSQELGGGVGRSFHTKMAVVPSGVPGTLDVVHSFVCPLVPSRTTRPSRVRPELGTDRPDDLDPVAIRQDGGCHSQPEHAARARRSAPVIGPGTRVPAERNGVHRQRTSAPFPATHRPSAMVTTPQQTRRGEGWSRVYDRE